MVSEPEHIREAVSTKNNVRLKVDARSLVKKLTNRKKKKIIKK